LDRIPSRSSRSTFSKTRCAGSSADQGSGLTALVHPLTDDDLADHTSLALWIGGPLPLDKTGSIRRDESRRQAFRKVRRLMAMRANVALRVEE
jgi:hypothetical protein